MQEVTKITVVLPFSYPERTVRRIGQALIEVIIQRTRRGLDKNGLAFEPYSKSYRDSLAFAQARKSGIVDLRLTNRMLSSLKVLETSNTYVVIGINDAEQVKKAYNHILGDTVPKRDFLGVSTQELNDALLNFPVPKEAELFEAWAKQHLDFKKETQQTQAALDDEVITLEQLERIKARLYQEAVDDFISVSGLYKVLQTKKRINNFLKSANNYGQFFREVMAENKKGFLTFRSQRIKGIEIL